MPQRDADEVLPFIDAHDRVLGAPTERAWDALVEVLRRDFDGPLARRFARLARCDATAGDDALPEEGGAVAGFRVARADPPRMLALAGRHYFARYLLVFRLDPVEEGRGTRLRAESRAVFPGLAGRLYRLAVIGTRGHVVAVRRLLGAVARRAEPLPRRRP